MSVLRIPEFYGIQQQKDGTLLPPGTARSSVNMDTSDGCLSVAEAFRTVVPAPSARQGEEWHSVFAFERTTEKDIYIACSNQRIVYCCSGEAAWSSLVDQRTTPTFVPSDSDSAFDAQLVRIGSTDYILIATGNTQIIKVPVMGLLDESPIWEWFGTGTFYLPSPSSQDFPLTITQVDTTEPANATITVDGDILSAETHPTENSRAYVFGIYIMDGNEVKYTLRVKSIEAVSTTPADGSIITLDLTGCTVTTSNTIHLRGGASDRKVSSLELYRDRLWSSGESEYPSRLYWSCAAGEGRTVEDWMSDDFDEDASGGHVDVGVADGDKIVALKAMTDCLLIFKYNSVWRLYGTRPSNYTLERISDETGACDDSEIVTRYGTPYWLTKNGIFYCDGTTALSADNDIDYLHNLLWNVNGKVRRPACSVPELRKIFFNVHSDDPSIGRFILTRDLVTGAYLTFDGANIVDITTAADDVLFLTDNGALIARGENTICLTHYNTTDGLSAKWVSQRLDLSGLHCKAQISALWFRALGGRIRISVHTDIGDTLFEVVPQEMQSDVIRLPVRMSEARTLQIEIENVNGSRFRIEGGIYVVYAEKVDA